MRTAFYSVQETYAVFYHISWPRSALCDYGNARSLLSEKHGNFKLAARNAGNFIMPCRDNSSRVASQYAVKHYRRDVMLYVYRAVRDII